MRCFPSARLSRRVVTFGLPLATLAATARAAPPDPADWLIEAQDPAARVRFRGDIIDIETPAGLTLWHRRRLSGATRIRFAARPVTDGGPNERLSDLNAFWMASDPASPDGDPRGRRSGQFEGYDSLRTYYVGIGGNGNTTTRMRRYTGRPGDRPLLPEHDRADAPALLRPNRWTEVELTADTGRIGVDRDGTPLFRWTDPSPYRAGWFGFRTTWSHWQLRDVRIETA